MIPRLRHSLSEAAEALGIGKSQMEPWSGSIISPSTKTRQAVIATSAFARSRITFASKKKNQCSADGALRDKMLIVAKRSNLEGTKRVDGRWEIRVTLTKIYGAKVRKSVFGETKSEAQQKAHQLIHEDGRSVGTGATITILPPFRKAPGAT